METSCPYGVERNVFRSLAAERRASPPEKRSDSREQNDEAAGLRLGVARGQTDRCHADLGRCGRSVVTGGYLFAYANDAWSKYDNNRGKVKLNIRRISRSDANEQESHGKQTGAG